MKSEAHAIIITGASGFVGRHLLDDLKNDYRVFAIARRSQHECNAPIHSNIAWIRADVSNFTSIEKAFREIKTAGGADCLFHLAAFYEFAGEDHPEYITTNVDGTRNVIKLAKELNLKRFIFASSVAACKFPKEGTFIDESTPADGEHIYAWSKLQGENLVKELGKTTPVCIVRLGAVYSDWCEYPPLYMFLNTWLSHSWKARILAGKGQSAIPYIHIRDVISFLRQVIIKCNTINSVPILNCCTEGSTSHLELYNLATKYYFGKEHKPIFMPKIIAGLGLYAMTFWGSLINKLPFERPWMRRYIDLKLNVTSRQTHQRLGWAPNSRYRIERRLLFLIERLKSEPFAWQMRNMAALRRATIRPDFNIYTALSDAENEIIDAVTKHIEDKTISFPHLQSLEKSEVTWFLKLIYRLLLTSIHTTNKLLIQNYFEISAQNRFNTGYTDEEIIYLLRNLNEIILQYLNETTVLTSFRDKFYDFVTMPIEFAIDEIEYQYQIFQQSPSTERVQQPQELFPKERSAREQLEETIWNCLVQRK